MRTHSLIFVAFASAPLLANSLEAQSLGERVRASNDVVQIVFPSRPDACGDGRGLIGNLIDKRTYYQGSYTIVNSGGEWRDRMCVHGPARIIATVIDHQIVSLRSYVGPVLSSDMRTFNASPTDAAAWLTDIVLHDNSRVANEAMLGLMLADETEPWQTLLRTARDEARPLSLRRNAMTWLSAGINAKLGLDRASVETDDDEVKKAAVFALSQHPRNESVPELIDIAKSSKSPVARREAIFWLGQTGDKRAADLYAELLGSR